MCVSYLARAYPLVPCCQLLRLKAWTFVQRDLKPQNLLLMDTSATPVVKIADFGFARNLQPQGLADTLCGSPLYMAPEILQFHKYDAKVTLAAASQVSYLNHLPAPHHYLFHCLEIG